MEAWTPMIEKFVTSLEERLRKEDSNLNVMLQWGTDAFNPNVQMPVVNIYKGHDLVEGYVLYEDQNKKICYQLNRGR